MIEDVFNREHYGIAFSFEEYYKTEDDTSSAAMSSTGMLGTTPVAFGYR